MSDDVNTRDSQHISEYCKEYGILKFDYANGYFIYGSKRPIRVKKLQQTFMLLFYLFLDPGKQIQFHNIFEFLTLPYKTKKDMKKSMEKVKHTLKHVRESLGINTRIDPTANPFIITAYGIGLANLK